MVLNKKKVLNKNVFFLMNFLKNILFLLTRLQRAKKTCDMPLEILDELSPAVHEVM